MSNTDYTLNNIWKCQNNLEPDKEKTVDNIVGTVRSLFQYFSRLRKYDEMPAGAKKMGYNR